LLEYNISIQNRPCEVCVLNPEQLKSFNLIILHIPLFSLLLYIDTYSIILYTLIFTHATVTMNQNKNKKVGPTCAWAQAKPCRLRFFCPRCFYDFICLHSVLFYILLNVTVFVVPTSAQGAPLSLVLLGHHQSIVFHVLSPIILLSFSMFYKHVCMWVSIFTAEARLSLYLFMCTLWRIKKLHNV